MGNKDAKTIGLQNAFWAEFREVQKSDDDTALLTFLAETLEADSALIRKRYWESGVMILVLVLALYFLMDYSFEGSLEQKVAFVLIPLGLAYCARRTESPRRPAILEAATETLLAPVVYSQEQKQQIVRVGEATFSSERKLRETCARALQRSS